MRATRFGLGGLGVLVGLYGAYLLLSREGSTAGVVATAIWLAVGVLLHDAVLAPLTIALVWLGRRLLPEAARGPALVGLVVLGTATVLAVPVLGRFGARADNPTLLDRHYVVGWVVLAALVLLAVVAASVRARRNGPVAPQSAGEPS